ncbi:MAG: 16S rRNA (cytosine(1402)-N(4))-methyltransferase RsmH [Lachnospiraceae bacterium]|nr:16S rRNA (cytosine(1402)-N(4))-methyltransferase RsmH [Lachnospiraceae bacterium]
MEFSHVPVLLDECMEALAIRPSGVYVDGTVGGAGHASHILQQLSSEGLLIGTDRDSDALTAANARLTKTREAMPEGKRPAFRLVKSNYGELPGVLAELGLSLADGILLDLGVSSYQLDSAERGFSYMKDAPLDMRMDRDESRTAADLLNESSEAELARILRDYGEERFAGLIAKRIVLARQKSPLKTTGELVRIIEQSIPAKYRNTGGHPAKRTFQAVRIALNHELTTLEECLPRIIDVLSPGGRLAVITFHSLEDRIVKNAFRTAEDPCICPKDFPVCVCGRVSRGKAVTRKPILPSEEEMKTNPRSASAKLRVFERAGAGGEA